MMRNFGGRAEMNKDTTKDLGETEENVRKGLGRTGA
jgi:hypothetical protein